VEGEKERTVGDSKICAQTQTDDSNYITDETTQTEQLHSDDQALWRVLVVAVYLLGLCSYCRLLLVCGGLGRRWVAARFV
jgi:hypothetical protein